LPDIGVLGIKVFKDGIRRQQIAPATTWPQIFNTMIAAVGVGDHMVNLSGNVTVAVNAPLSVGVD
jgi:hypothetical protein